MLMVMRKLKVGILGATGIVGQTYLRLLENHPFFDVIDVAASPRSAQKTFNEAVANRWHMSTKIPNNISSLKVRDTNEVESIDPNVKLVFSAVNLPNKEEIKKLEFDYARSGIPVISNNSAHRWTEDVPMIIPEINHEHLNVIPIQQRYRGFKKGFVVVKPNCSIQSYMTPLFALEQNGFIVEKLIVTTLQAVSGAGYPGVASLDIIDNIVPFIGGEEEKSEKEPLKVLGTINESGILNRDGLLISATCTRVPVIDGHTAVVYLKFKDNIPTKEEILKIWRSFHGPPQDLNLPLAPKQPIIYLSDNDRPQPIKDRDVDKGMAVTIGRLREDKIFDYKFVALSHNTIRGAAGGAILIGELLYQKGYFD
jgi:aspartate-semialdehyde dehydrogenase